MLCVKWHDGTTTWEWLADLKESYPVEIAEFAVAHNFTKKLRLPGGYCMYLLDDSKSFWLWIDAITSALTNMGSKYPRIMMIVYKSPMRMGTLFGRMLSIKRCPKSESHSCKILNVIPPMNQDIICHMVVDVKIEDFCRKAWFVAGGHMTETPSSNTYASFVSRESARIA
jgi:hypothetical protein